MQPGTRLGPYEIVSRIGAGGMGEVWRALDTRLGREVAIKILPAEFAEDAKLKIRFEREARTISHLSHPNICTLFDVGENYLVMELLDGETLADRVARGPLPLSEVLRYGVQLAEALGKAHREGVIHRDLKPGNVMLTKSGAKLLDFGLAKSTAVSPLLEGETLKKPLTAEGAVLGTFQYMAPEQLAGEEPDARTDIFAFGAVLYEMATGKRAFEGKNRTSLIGAIVSGEPRPMRELQPLTPPALEHLITKCLVKDPDDRWQSAQDVAEELRWMSQAGSQAGVASGAVIRRRWRERLLWIVGLLAVVAAGSWFHSATLPAGPPTIESLISLGETGGISYFAGPPAFSPDGNSLAIAADDKAGRRMLWVRSIGSPVLRPLPNTEGAGAPFWSPDGQFIGFIANSKLKKIATGGGDASVISTASVSGGGTWSRDGVIVYSVGQASAPLFRVSAAGDNPTAIVTPASIGAATLAWPSFLPDGKHFLFLATGGTLLQTQQEGVWVAALDGSDKPRFVTNADSNASYVEPGWLLCARGGILRAQRFDPKSLRVTTEAAVVSRVQWWGWNSGAQFSASGSGLLVYLPEGSAQLSELLVKSRKGEVLRNLGRGFFWSPRLSPDGRQVAVDNSDKASAGDIWVLSATDGSASRVTFDPLNETAPIWSPDNKTLAYMYGEHKDPAIGIKRAGAAAEVLLTLPNTLEAPLDWSSDGRSIAVMRIRGAANADVVVLSVETRKLTEVAAGPAIEAAAAFSPDSHWLAYQSDESGRNEVYVQPFPPTGAKYQVSTAGGYWPRWRMPNEITYVDATNHVALVHVETAGALVSSPAEIFPLIVDNRGDLAWSDYDVAPDGNILVNAVVRENPPPLTLVTNWYGRLETTAKK
jgi:serine/threonine protein kinase